MSENIGQRRLNFLWNISMLYIIFMPLVPFYTPNFYDVFRGFRKRLVTWNGLKVLQNVCEHSSSENYCWLYVYSWIGRLWYQPIQDLLSVGLDLLGNTFSGFSWSYVWACNFVKSRAPLQVFSEFFETFQNYNSLEKSSSPSAGCSWNTSSSSFLEEQQLTGGCFAYDLNKTKFN